VNDQSSETPVSPFITRREWLGRVAVPIALAGTTLSTAECYAAAPPRSTSGNDLGARVYNIRDFGAKGDGATLDTTAIQRAVDTCHAEGGGTVLVPSGTFLIGTVELKSNITLHIAATGKLLGSGDGKQYHAVDAIPLRGDHTLGDGNWALLFAVKANNLTIEGPGTIDGQGAQFHSAVKGTPPPSGLRGNRRPYHILAYHCENLRVRNISMLDGAYHSIRVIQSQRVHIDSVYIHNRVNGNNDGFHFISAEYVTVSNCIVKSQDDACALFGSCKHVTITNSFFSTRWSVFRFGGGFAEDISVSNCLLHEVYGCPIKLHADMGARFENISFSNLVLQNVTGPINFSIGPGPAGIRPRTAAGESVPPVVRNISFSNIQGNITTDPAQLTETNLTSGYNPGERHSCISLNCVEGSTLENISFDNIHLTFGGGGTADDAARRDLPEYAGEYFALGPMPAYGFYARHARGITLNNIRFQTASPDMRPAVVLDRSQDVAMTGLAVQGNPNAESVLRIQDSEHVLLTSPRVLGHSGAFLQIEGAHSANICIEGGDLSRASAPVIYAKGATENSVKLRNL
jgi:polygalacturonase